jgi:Dyp-type peroxidase family
MPSTDPPVVPLDKVQGIILRGYERLEEATFVLLKITDVAAAQGWLAGLVDNDQIMNATKKPGEVIPENPNPALKAVNIAFTWPGLLKLLRKENKHDDLQNFSREFQEGMVTPHRKRVLGDAGESAPEKWRWGNEATTPDILLMLYAIDPARLKELVEEQKKSYTTAGLEEIKVLETFDLFGRKEQFGFRDGIAQPFIEGVIKEPPNTEIETPIPGNILKAGEVLLGYDNEYEKSRVLPLVKAEDGQGYVDFGSNGSYLVFRQLHQDVPAFWKYLYEAATGKPLPAAGEDVGKVNQGVQDGVPVAAKMVGRWPSGAPLMLHDSEVPSYKLDEDKYGFAENDPLGIKCPIGSHTRRSNPRDSLEPGPNAGRLTIEESLKVTKRHRIVRRGRPYGPPVDPSMDPVKMVQKIAAMPNHSDGVERGLHFLCFNADIARQFEFIQQTWVNNPKFAGLYADSDPIMGQRYPAQVTPIFKVTEAALAALAKLALPGEVLAKLSELKDREIRGEENFLAELELHLDPHDPRPWWQVLVHQCRLSTADNFTWQDVPGRRRFTKLPDFVTVRGGAYFFMPGLDAVRYLAGRANVLETVALKDFQ